ncbi:hypothetical protein [Rhizobium laguerreae]|uniref:hypothetical protein n=1 Tax=Rhizobium laguerreae TaxID=1076926 RepID=UPI001FD1A9B2|nr:hypothetical protein [Rhizobium laguerreae]
MFKKYAYAWITVGFFLFSLTGHWLFGWFAFVGEQQNHGQVPDVIAYLMRWAETPLKIGSPNSCNCSGRSSVLPTFSISDLRLRRKTMTVPKRSWTL